ncbi:type VII secretion system-associated protein [Streptomyces sp. NPDC051954]|uniref:type VII secretion system-associated protein n=1 Tax=unclassified Streptomyces TaxID=2593676 RepID=UPI003446535B
MAAGNDDKSEIVLDKEWMKNFINNEILEFQAALKKIGTADSSGDGPTVPKIADLGGNSRPVYVSPGGAWPLTMGLLEDEEGGGYLQDQVKSLANTLGGFIEDQQLLFDDIESNMRETLRTLLKAEEDNLSKIDGQKLLNVFEDVVDDVADSSATGESSSDT